MFDGLGFALTVALCVYLQFCGCVLGFLLGCLFDVALVALR